MSIKSEMRVKDVMLNYKNTPIVSAYDFLKEAMETMDKYRLGIVCIINKSKNLQGILTDGDIRRMLTKVQKPIGALMGDDVIIHCVHNPLIVDSEKSLISALALMQEKQVWDIPVVDDSELVGLLHLHPAIKAVLDL